MKARTRIDLLILIVVAALTAALAVVLGVALAAPASAATARVQLSTSSADPDFATNITVSGQGFQSVQGGFGGIYVVFGTTDSRWRPSQGGVSGTDYIYVQDVQTKANHGYQQFVAFPGSSTAGDANAVMAADGSWRVTLVVPGASFPAAGGKQINCRSVQCGVITIGAHGVVNATNETFSPVSFVALKAAVTTPAASASAPIATTPIASAPVVPVVPPTTTVASPSMTASASDSAAAPLMISAAPVASTKSSSSAVGWWIGALVLAALLVSGGAGLWLRRRKGVSNA
jgi:hypothetical protein